MIVLTLVAQLALTQPPPPPTPETNPSIVVVSTDTTPGDSVRVILERDFNDSDRLDVTVLDSASRASLVSDGASGRALDTMELALYNPTFVLRVVRHDRQLQVALYNVARHRFTHTAVFRVTTDSVGNPTRLQMHQIADRVQQWITGAPGIAATRIAYVYDGHVHVIDTDGYDDQQFPTQGVALSPSWHPRATSLVYSDLTDAGTQVGKIDLATRKVRLFAMTPRGLNITPVFTPRGDSIVYATAGPRGSRLVIGSARGRGHVHLFRPRMPADVHDMAEPTFDPDGRTVAFVASRPLYPQIYTMQNNGKHLQRFVPYTPGLRNERTAPEWSPDGRKIAYQQQNHQFQIWIALIRKGIADTTIRITSTAENRDPSWAPDSHHLVLTSTRGGDQELWILDVPTGRWRQLTTTPGARLAAWSPTLR